MSFNSSKRSIQTSSNSDTSPVKKKTKIALKRNLTHSSSSSSDETEVSLPSTTRQHVPASSKQPAPHVSPKAALTSLPAPAPTTARIQIQRSSSSDDSNGSDEIVTKRTRQRRKKPVATGERSTILNQMKRKTQERKNSAQPATTDNNNNMSVNDAKSESRANGKKKCQFQFSDDDDDDDQDVKKVNDKPDNGDTTESYEVENEEEEKHNKSNGTIKNEANEETYEFKDDDDDDESSPNKKQNGHGGRKNIRKIIDDQELDRQTKHAVEAELERRRRIVEKQKEYNDILLEKSTSTKTIKDQQPSTTTNPRLILELDATNNEPVIEVSPKLVQQLKPHQCDGIRFLWNNVFESIDAIQNKKHEGNGCILAHCMGLGKTLQVVSFIHTILNYDQIIKVRTCLVLCPINAALNWSNEFDYWLTDVDPPVDHYQLTTIKPNLRLTHLNYWFEHGGVMIMGYEMYRRLATGVGLKNKKSKAQAFKCLLDPGPDIIVADEGHILKNAQTALAKCLSKIRTRRRIVLTGTPLQNNLIEYFCMVSFIKPNLLGSQQEYINRFVNPIQNGQHRDSNEGDVRLMRRRACVLHELLTGFIDRKDYSLLKEYLPPKFEYIINIRMCDLQSNLYEIYLRKQQSNQSESLTSLKKDFKSAKLFADYQYLQKIWTHPFLLYPHFIDHWKKRLYKDEDDMLDDDEFDAMFTDEDEEMEETKTKKKKKKKSKKKPATTEAKAETKKHFSGFLIDNVGDDEEDADEPVNPEENAKKSKRTTSSSSATTTESGSYVEDEDEKVDSQSKSKEKDDEEAQVEIVKSYRTRSRTAANHQEKPRSNQKQPSKKPNGKHVDFDIFDTGNDNPPAQEAVQEDGDDEEQPDTTDEPWSKEMHEQFWFPFLDMLPDESEFDIQLSGKFLLLKSILDKCGDIGDKIILFSRSLYTLNYIERFLHFLHKQQEQDYQKQCEARRQLRQLLAANGNDATKNNLDYEYIPPPVQWQRDEDYFRMDGQTDVVARKRYAKTFNDENNSRARLFLISTLAGGIGINLVGSNRVIVFDASWNPSHDTQAIFRSYRFGQKKPVYIYRFLAQGTMEEKIYQRQVVKQSLSQRVIDDHQLDRHFTENDIKELYKFTPEPLPEARPTSNSDFNYPIPKDHLLLDLLYDHQRWIHSYHSHDSLLENKLDEGLSEDERRRALEEYENLKRAPDPRQLAAQRLQQQQQLTSAAMVQLPHLQQMYLDLFRTMSAEDQNTFDYSKMLQYAFEIGLGQALVDGQNLISSESNPPTTNPSSNPADVVVLESDEEGTAEEE